MKLFLYLSLFFCVLLACAPPPQHCIYTSPPSVASQDYAILASNEYPRVLAKLKSCGFDLTVVDQSDWSAGIATDATIRIFSDPEPRTRVFMAGMSCSAAFVYVDPTLPSFEYDLLHEMLHGLGRQHINDPTRVMNWRRPNPIPTLEEIDCSRL